MDGDGKKDGAGWLAGVRDTKSCSVAAVGVGEAEDRKRSS